jgi:hypothetical protein
MEKEELKKQNEGFLGEVEALEAQVSRKVPVIELLQA